MIAGRAAVVEVAIEDGRIVLLGFRVQHRAQSHGTFKLLFNSLLIGAIEASEGTSHSRHRGRALCVDWSDMGVRVEVGSVAKGLLHGLGNFSGGCFASCKGEQ